MRKVDVENHHILRLSRLKKTLLFIQESRTCSCKALVGSTFLFLWELSTLWPLVISFMAGKSFTYTVRWSFDLDHFTPKNPMVLLIIIPMKNGFFIGGIPNIFRHTQTSIPIYLDKFLFSSLISSYFALMFFFTGATLGHSGDTSPISESDRKSVKKTPLGVGFAVSHGALALEKVYIIM